MNRIDTERIKNMTKQMIGYENYKKEKIMKRIKIRNIAFVFLGAITLCMGALTVDALTKNAISNSIKDAFSINVGIDGKEKIASCNKKEDGTITCVVDKQVNGDENTTFDVEAGSN